MQNDTGKAFDKLKTIEELIDYLDDYGRRLSSSNFVYHYTKVNRVIDIYTSKKWHLSNAKCMNDTWEYNCGDKNRWENIFFASFMTEVKESIGMWSMYSQPWEEGVVIKIPKDIFKKWIEGVEKIWEVSYVGEKCFETGESKDKNEMNKVFISSVAYTNCDNPDSKEVLTWNTVSNEVIKQASHIPELTGYIKDAAWSYEREIRIKAVLGSNHKYSRVAIDVPDEVLDSITIVTGPLFKGDIIERIGKTLQERIATEGSFYTNKLNIKTPCGDCNYKTGKTEN